MGDELNVALIAMIAALAFVQSIFGIGMLIFGTPLLLFFGYPFEQILLTLLPASLTISILQMVIDRGLLARTVSQYFSCMVPPLCGGVLISLAVITPQLDLIVSVVLVIVAYLRLSARHRMRLFDFASTHQRMMLVLIGSVHGMTNLGGSLLEAYVSSVHKTKHSIRQNIALGYAIMAASQLAVLFALGRGNLNFTSAVSVTVAGTVFLTVGRLAFGSLSQHRYTGLVSTLIIAAAVALIAKRAIAHFI